MSSDLSSSFTVQSKA